VITSELAQSTAKKAGKNRLIWLSRFGTLIAFAILLLFNFIFTTNFLSWQTVILNLTQVAPIVIVAVGMTLVIATAGIDLSVGSMMAIAGALAPMIFLGNLLPFENYGLLMTLAFTIPLIATGILGWFNGFLVTKFSIQPIVATLVLFIAGRGIAQVLTNGNLQSFTNKSLVPEFKFIAQGYILGIPFQVIVMGFIVAAAWFLVNYTGVGRQILAVGGNEKAARLSGINSSRIKRIVYIISATLAGISGLIVVARNSASDANLVGMLMELDAIAAVAVGGTLLSGGRAYILGTVLGAFVIQLVRYTLLANGVPDAAALVVKAGLIILAVYLQQRATAK
jgi:ribose/xylose/arabinose/galactoside ABC-type transport system permease subunit